MLQRAGTTVFAALGCLLLLGLAADAAHGDAAPAPDPGAAPAPAPEGAGPDWPGLRRDTAYVLSYQVATIGILYMLPESISNWSDEQKEEYSLSQWWENVSNPQWDDDKFWINYLAHPYWGAAYYVRARERGYDERASFWYSAAMSAAFEFGAEALFEQPSIQDLIVTPVGGVILGEYFMAWRAAVISRHEPGQPMPFRDRALLALTDPLGAINSRVQSWLGIESESSFYPYASVRPVGGGRRYAADSVDTERVYGVQLNYRW